MTWAFTAPHISVCTVPLCHMVGLWVYTGLIQGIKWGWYFDTSLSFGLLCCWFLCHCWFMVTWGFGTVLTRKKGNWNLWRKCVSLRTPISKHRFSKGWLNKIKKKKKNTATLHLLYNCAYCTYACIYLCMYISTFFLVYLIFKTFLFS